MFNEKRIADIRENIQSSTLLTDREKADWLNLLELMNDKQLKELEEILSSDKPSAQPSPLETKPQVAPVPQGSSLPPLTHIANIPAGVNMTHSMPPGVKPVAAKPIAPKPAVPLNSTRTPAPVHKPAAPLSVPPQIPPKAATPTSKSSSASVKKTPLQIEHVEDIQTLSLETLRAAVFQSVVDTMRDIITQYGYFQVLQLLEASPLYNSYIQAGQDRLQGKQSDMTQEEFEFMTDLLSHMRFNRW